MPVDYSVLLCLTMLVDSSVSAMLTMLVDYSCLATSDNGLGDYSVCYVGQCLVGLQCLVYVDMPSGTTVSCLRMNNA